MAKQKQKNNAPNIGQQLLDALTQEEITQFVNALLAVLSAKLQEEAIAHLPKNTQQTIQQILAPTTPAHSTSSHTAPTASLAKQQDTWSQHWRKWDSILREAEKERGKYIVQEVHWEPPYFDTTAFAEDLDKVAEKMQPLVQTAFEHEFQPNHGFGDALLEAEAAVSGALEEWMEIDGLYLEQHVTLCFLQWEWLISQEQEQNAFEFVQEICNYETQAPNLELDRHTLLDFLTQLPDADQHCILEGLTANQATPFWQDALDKVHSHWHELYLLLLEQYAPDYYLENLRQTISQEWENGLPVIEALLAEQNYAESWTVIQDMLNALLKSKQVQHWTPDQSLWVHYLGFYAEGEATDVGRLMQFYQQTARGLRKPGVANALAVQQVAIAQWFNWSAMFDAFAEIPLSKSTHQTLFKSWQKYVDRRSNPHERGYGERTTVQSWWALWLMESIADPQKGIPWFQQQITEWLTHLPTTRHQLGENYEMLQLLTRDLTEVQSQGKSQYPRFYQVVIPSRQFFAADDQSRQAYLKQYAPADLLKQVMNYWKAHLQNFVPKPESAAKSDYTPHANWMAALQELSPKSYQTLLAEWQTQHQRRSNLWFAMEQAGLN